MVNLVAVRTLFAELLSAEVGTGADFEASWGVSLKFFRSEIFFADLSNDELLFLKKSASYHDGFHSPNPASRGDIRAKIKDLVSEQKFQKIFFGRSGSNFEGSLSAHRRTSLPNLEYTRLLVGSEFTGKCTARGTFQIFLSGFYGVFTASNSAWPNFGELLPFP